MLLALALLLPLPERPFIPGTTLSLSQQGQILAACPRLGTTQGHGTGVVIGERDGWAYALTAAHVVPFDAVEIAFTVGANAAWQPDEARVVKRWGNGIDLALVRFRVGSRKVAAVPLAGPGQRPKRFPAVAFSVGAATGEASTVNAENIVAKRLVRSPEAAGPVAFFWETSRPSRPGRSGGPLLDERGRIIGICAATQQGRGYFLHLDEILAALSRDGESRWLVPDGK